MPASITNPNDLVQAFKTSGEFSRLRRELFNEFQEGDGITGFKERIEEIVKQRLSSDQKLKYLPQDTVQRELMQEVERFPVIERAVADMRSFADGSLFSTIQASATRILQEAEGIKPSETSTPSPAAPPPAATVSAVSQPLSTEASSSMTSGSATQTATEKSTLPVEESSETQAQRPSEQPSVSLPAIDQPADREEDEKMVVDSLSEEKSTEVLEKAGPLISGNNSVETEKEHDLQPDASM